MDAIAIVNNRHEDKFREKSIHAPSLPVLLNKGRSLPDIASLFLADGTVFHFGTPFSLVCEENLTRKGDTFLFKRLAAMQGVCGVRTSANMNYPVRVGDYVVSPKDRAVFRLASSSESGVIANSLCLLGRNCTLAKDDELSKIFDSRRPTTRRATARRPTYG